MVIIERMYHNYYMKHPNPPLVLRSLDSFFGGKLKEQSRELEKANVQESKQVRKQSRAAPPRVTTRNRRKQEGSEGEHEDEVVPLQSYDEDDFTVRF